MFEPKMMRSSILIVMIVISFATMSNCDAKDSEEEVSHQLTDKSCWVNSVLVECFKRCKDPKKTVEIYTASSKQVGRANVTQYIRDRKKKKLNPFGCLVKCMTNPALEVCKRNCQPPPVDFIAECHEEPKCKATPTPLTPWLDANCMECYRTAIIGTPGKLGKVNICNNNVNKPAECLGSIVRCAGDARVDSAEDLKMCFLTLRMELDILECQTKEGACRNFGLEYLCDEKCTKFLRNDLCQKTCVTQEEIPFDTCVKGCDKQRAPLCNDACDLVEECHADCSANSDADLDCFSDCEGRFSEIHKLPSLAGLTRREHFYPKCMEATLDEIQLYITNPAVRTLVFPTSLPEDYDWILNRFLPEECFNSCEFSTDKSKCYDEVCKKDLSDTIRSSACRANPFRIKSSVLYAAAGGKSLRKADVESAFANDLDGYLYDPSDAATRDAFLNLLHTSRLDCLNQCTDSGDEEAMELSNAECNFDCFAPNKIRCRYDPVVSVSLSNFANCQWVVSLSESKSPFTLTATYFDDKGSYDEKDKLEQPNATQYLETTVVADSQGYFVFPYFLVVRAECDGGYYDDAFYRLFMYGGNPAVEVEYSPSTARDHHQSVMKARFTGALINLKRDEQVAADILVPENVLERVAGSSKGCHLEICYPGFALPMPMYRIPSFQVVVQSHDVFSRLVFKAYVSSFHQHNIGGSGALQITNAYTNSESLVIPSTFFPLLTDRVLETEDEELETMTECLDDASGYCPFIYPPPAPTATIIAEFEPLDGEDFFEPKFTFRTSPQIAMAGFYHPNLIILGDPDMNNFHLVNWTYQQPDQNATVFDIKYPCLQTYKAGYTEKYQKPMYSQVDRNDPKFPLKYYRVRYDPKDYARAAEGDANAFGIFDIVALEDRLLLVTVSGLVVFYGSTNATVATNRHFKAYEQEKVRKCFKFLRVAKTAQMENDIVIGVTYTYNVQVDTNLVEVNQELLVGKYTKPGVPLEWQPILAVSNQVSDEEQPDYDIPRPNAGEAITLHPGKPIGDPTNERLDKAKSEIERICFKAYTEKMSSSLEIFLKENQGWCEAIDASPVPTKQETLQILVRMTVYYVGQVAPGKSPPSWTPERNVVFYILASHTLRKSQEQKVLWIIDSILPRIPCLDEHRESVRNVELFDLNYFTAQGTESTGNTALGCQNINRNSFDDHIYLTRMSYTRTISNHLFVYGSRILQSTDAGLSFVSLRSFPHEDSMYHNTASLQYRLRHRIEIIAFGDSGHYAFLTNLRELWIGNTGDLLQIRIRPSKGYSMTQTIVSQTKGLQDGVPFSLMYDYADKLFEMVGVLDVNNNVERILKRPVPIDIILRNQKMSDEFAKKTKELTAATTPPEESFQYDKAQWNLYCPFSSPKVTENYSIEHTRTQSFLFSPPRQHETFGIDYKFNSLQAFQVATYSLVWKSFFNVEYTPYSLLERDPFKIWVEKKSKTAEMGFLKFLRGDPNLDGILVIPSKNQRITRRQQAKKLLQHYFLDYGALMQVEMTFSIKSAASLENTNYFTQQISQIQLNVDNANGTLLQIDTEKILLASSAAVKFLIRISVIKSRLLQQNLPGQHLLPVPIVFHLIGAFGKCVNKRSDPLVSDTSSTVIFVGCKPSTDILFNWNETVYSIKFRDQAAHFGVDETCYDDEHVCFFARNPLVLHFDVFDMPRQRYTPYKGNYVISVIAGGYSKESMTEYTAEEIEAYNIPGVSDVSLIWNEWNVETQTKIDRDPHKVVPEGDTDPRKLTRETVLRAGESAIQWACHTLSPCARITPNIALQTVYWFRIKVSNRGVDNSTLCLYEKTFDIMLYGFPPSPETQLLTTILFCLCMLGILYLLFVCCRGHKRVWRASKVKMYGWYQIVKDTFPKPLKTHEAEGADEGHTQQQKDNIILSLQGHLKIPELMGRDSIVGGSGRQEQRLGSSVSQGESNLSLTSGQSSFSQQQVLNPVATRNAATTWTDLVYEQIIAKRLSAIVAKNNKMRANILRKASVRISSDAEHEKRYEDEHKRTLSEESIFEGDASQEKRQNKK